MNSIQKKIILCVICVLALTMTLNSQKADQIKLITDSTSKKSTNQECDTICFNNKKWCNHKFEFEGYLFSDFVGIKDDQPNGLVQTNVYFCYTRPLRIRPLKKEQKKKLGFYTYPLKNVVLIDITLSKLGNQNLQLPARYSQNENDQLAYFNRFDLIQYSNIIAVTKINLIALEWDKIASVYFDFCPIFYKTSIYDSLRIDETDKKTGVSSIAFGGNIKIISEKDERTGLSADVSYSFYVPKLYSTKYSDKEKYQINEYKSLLEEETILNPKQKHAIQIIDMRIKHSPVGKNGKISTFFRFSIFHNVFRNYNRPGNVFVQFQLGATFNINSFIKGSNSN